MKINGSLHLQMFGLLGLYLASFFLICFSCFNAQFGIGWEALLRSPVGDRVDTIADAIDDQLSNTAIADWSKVLRNFERIYNVKFYVFDAFGRQLAGDKVALPPPIESRVAEFRMPPPGGGRFFHGPPDMDGPDGIHGPHDRGGPPADLGPGAPPELKGPQEKAGPAERHGLPADLGQHHEGVPPNLHGPNAPDAAFDMPVPPPPPPPPPPPGLHAHGRFMIRTENPTHFWIGCKVLLMNPGMRHPLPGVVLASTNHLWSSSLLIDSYFVGSMAAAIIGLTILFWYPFIYSITRALSEVTLATEHIAEGRFDTTLKVRGRDEIGRLSEAVNRMADRLNHFVKGQRRFLGDIAHELFSPLARLHAALELLDDAIPAEHRDLIVDIREEVEEMNTLLHELLAYSKAGLQEKPLELKPVNLKVVFANVLGRLATETIVQLVVPDYIIVMADPVLLDRSMSNIIRNAVRYAGECGPIEVKAESVGPDVTITISDKGPGVAPEMLSRLGEPFFRPESARSRSSGGVGLGLAIVKSCVEAFGGSLNLRNRQGGGFEVEVQLKSA